MKGSEFFYLRGAIQIHFIHSSVKCVTV